MFKTYIFISTFLFLGIGAFAQKSSFSDSVYLSEVVVCKSRSATYNEGTKRIEIDSITLVSNKTTNLGELLTLNSTLAISSYGSGYSSTSISLRNAGASRTLVTWGGFPLNSLSMGSTDISIIPTSGFNSISINYGASGSLYGSGAFGGAVDLEYIPSYDNKIHVQYTGAIGSFSTIDNNLSISTSSKRIQYQGSFFFNRSDADFPYFDSVRNEQLTRTNAEYYNYGTIQYLYFKPVEQLQIGFGAWYHVKFNNLPAIMGKEPNNFETQKDSSFKVFTDISYKFRKNILHFKIAYFNDFQHYIKKMSPSDSLYSQYTKIYNKPLYGDLNYRLFLFDNLKLDIGFLYNRQQVKLTEGDTIENYSELQNVYAGVVALKYKLGPWTTNIAGRYEIYSADKNIPTFSIGSEIVLFKKRVLFRGQYAQKYRRPSFNDRYWPVWGNADLKPEYGDTWDIGTNIVLIKNNKHKLSFDMTQYFLFINEMIMWMPVDGGKWNPVNYAKVNNIGNESYVYHTFVPNDNINISNSLCVTFTNSYVAETDDNDPQNEGANLFYIPKIRASYVLEVKLKWFTIQNKILYTSKREYKEDKVLKDYVLIHPSVAFDYDFEKLKTHIAFNVYNITNTSYEMYKTFPMPGIHYKLTLQLTF